METRPAGAEETRATAMHGSMVTGTQAEKTTREQGGKNAITSPISRKYYIRVTAPCLREYMHREGTVLISGVARTFCFPLEGLQANPIKELKSYVNCGH